MRLDLDKLNDIEGEIRRSIEASLTRLRADKVELFQLHNPIAEAIDAKAIAKSEVLRSGGIADVFDRLRQEGYFSFQGITGLGETPAIIEVLESGRFDTAQVYYNMLNPSADRPLPDGWGGQDLNGILDVCEARNIGVMNIRVLAAGVLATDERHGREGAITADTDLAGEEARARRLFERLGNSHGTRAQTSLRFALGTRRLSTIVVGIATLDQLDEALQAFEAGPLPGEALSEIEACYQAGPLQS